MTALDCLKAWVIRLSESFIRARLVYLFLALPAAWPFSVCRAEASEIKGFIRHEIEAEVSPDKHLISVHDRITLPTDFGQEFTFLLHKNISLISKTEGITILREESSDVVAASYRITLPAGTRTLALGYQCAINHPVEPVGKEQARGFSSTPGIISEEGVFLAGSSYWYPVIEGRLLTFSLRVELPSGWDAVSQGRRGIHDKGESTSVVQWDSPEPQDEIYLVAGRFTEYTRSSDHISLMVFLRTPDNGLAQKYLDSATRYISMYEKLIGPYPYSKFALVENFWETGFGMPSFTLLGSKIIRLPFIINTSYPHEILHNWWGNSVFPDYDKGNWSEGLSAYLSDHLLKEQEGSGAEYRQTTLQKYVDYVSGGKDFPLVRFRSRHSTSSEAIGYGKSLMFFHMLRRELGDRTFIKGLRNFYRNNRFSTASFADLRRSFEKASGKELTEVFRQWLEKAGAPILRLGDAKVRKDGEGYLLTASIEQVQPGEAYLLRVPVAVTTEVKEDAYQVMAEMSGKRVDLKLHLSSRPTRVDVDPEFDVFRRLDRKELPPAISQALGAKRMLILLPSSSDRTTLLAYRDLAKALGDAGPDEVELKLDTEVKRLPSDSAVVILGWENRFLSRSQSAFAGYNVSLTSRDVSVGKTVIPRKNHSVVLAGSNPENIEFALIFIGADLPEALPGLARKIPHYHKYSYLVFEGDEPANVLKGRWPVIDSPMTLFLPGDGGTAKAGRGRLTPRRPLISPDELLSRERMMETIMFLTDGKLQGRGLETEGLDQAAEYIALKFQEAGLRPGGDDEGSYFQTWEEHLKKEEGDLRRVTMKNVIGVVAGRKHEFSGQSIVVGAHYDHLGLGWPEVREGNRGRVHPGADDNASGVSLLIELARVFGKMNPDRSIVFVAFTGEEAGKRGSKYYVAHQKRYPAKKCLAMINLDTVGRLEGRELLVLGASSAMEWPHIFRDAGFLTGVEIGLVSEQLDSSDQVSFEEAGVPAVQLFTGPHPDYHRPTDTPDKIDPGGMIKIASVAKEVIEYLSALEKPLSATLKKASGIEGKKERKVVLGAIPDFSHTGKGFRVSGVVPGSPAEGSGLKEGDIIIGVNSRTVDGIKDLSEILKSLSPGSRVTLTFVREGKELTIETEVREK